MRARPVSRGPYTCSTQPPRSVCPHRPSQSLTARCAHRFRANEVIKAVKALLDERLKGKKYDSSESAQLSKELCTEIVPPPKIRPCSAVCAR